MLWRFLYDIQSYFSMLWHTLYDIQPQAHLSVSFLYVTTLPQLYLIQKTLVTCLIFLGYDVPPVISDPLSLNNSSLQSYLSMLLHFLYDIQTRKPCSTHLFSLIILLWRSLYVISLRKPKQLVFQSYSSMLRRFLYDIQPRNP